MERYANVAKNNAGRTAGWLGIDAELDVRMKSLSVTASDVMKDTMRSDTA